MDKSSKIRELLRTITGTEKPTFNFRQMEVVSVDGDLCRAKIGDFEIPDVRLASIGDGSENGVLVTPTVGSIILVADISCGNLREMNAIGYSEIDSIRFHQGKATVKADAEAVAVTVGQTTVHIEDGKISLQTSDQKYGGLVRIVDLVGKLNTIEDSINELKMVLAAWAPIANDGGGALKTAITDWAASMLQPTQQAEIENTKVTH